MEQDLVIPTYQSQVSEENYAEKCQILKGKLCVQESHGAGPGDPHPYQSQASEENYEEKCQILKPKLCVHCTGKPWSRTW